MRPLALLGLVASLVLGGVALSTTSDNAASRRADQDRSLQAATSAEASLIENAMRESRAEGVELTSVPAVSALLRGAVAPGATGAAAVRDASLMLGAMQRTSFVPITSACLLDHRAAQIACAPGGRAGRAPLPESVRREMVALAASGPQAQAVSSPFLSPVTGRLSVAFLVPLVLGGRLAGVIHLDVDSSQTQTRAIVADRTPGVRVELAAFEHGTLQLNNRGARLTQSGLQSAASLPVQNVRLGRQPVRLLNGDHRVMALALPLTFGAAQESVAVVATAVVRNPDMLNSWDAGTLGVMAFAVLLLLSSAGVLTHCYRQMARELTLDPLTRLGNRRALMADLEHACAKATVQEPARLWLFDLDGFKRYNDAFGKVAGDTMLERLAQRLSKAMADYGKVYRVGGDELCVLIRGPLKDPQGLLAEAQQVLEERGGAFDITASAGAVSIPRDTGEPTQALLLADQRMYHEKATKGADATELVTSVLTAALAQRHPDLGDHTNDVAEEVELLARSVGLDEEAVTLVKSAASLHDIGKLGVPDKIITKPGPLNDEEWEFIKQHTVIGERIIAAAGLPLDGIGPLVRSSHERWDGTGYPDGLVAEEIPLGARIITICDAFGAMVAERVYKPPMSIEDALEELQRCAGTQFDPHLVEIFCRIIAERTGLDQRARDAVG
jgi:diguanylate cyclase (GGDEF)-like protein